MGARGGRVFAVGCQAGSARCESSRTSRRDSYWRVRGESYKEDWPCRCGGYHSEAERKSHDSALSHKHSTLATSPGCRVVPPRMLRWLTLKSRARQFFRRIGKLECPIDFVRCMAANSNIINVSERPNITSRKCPARAMIVCLPSGFRPSRVSTRRARSDRRSAPRGS